MVLDEVHYLQNRYRGAVWEEVIIHLAPEVDLICLSATVSNAEEVADWIATVRGDTTAIIEERRPVELTNLYAVGERGSGAIELLPTFAADDGGGLRPNPEAARLDGRRSRRGPGQPRTRAAAPRRSDLVALLAERDMLPAIGFIFSRAACDDAVRQCLDARLILTTTDERRALRRIADERSAPLSDDDLDALGYQSWLSGLEAGIAAHHAGLVPPLKEATEEAFAAGLVKVVFADRDALPRHQHAGAQRRDREALEVHGRAPRVPHAGRVHPAHRTARDVGASIPWGTPSSAGTPSCRSIRSRDWRRAGPRP